MRSNHLGFTLIELMVTLTVLALLILLAVPDMATWAKNAKVRSVAESLQNDLRAAQMESVKRSARTVFALTNATPALLATPTATGQKWYVQTLPLTGSDQKTGEMVLSSSAAAQNGVSISADGGFICFNSVGRLSNATATGFTGSCAVGANAATPVKYAVSMTGADRPLNVMVSLGGKIRICDPNKTLSSSQPDGC